MTLAFLVLLEKLSPEERAVFLLKEIFEYEHAEIAEMLGMTTENSRQMLHRAKAQAREGRPRLAGSQESRRAVAERFTRAFSTGDGAGLARCWPRTSACGATAAARPQPPGVRSLGRDEVLNFLVGLHRTAQASGLSRSASLQIEDVNSEPALIVRVGGRLESIFVLHDRRRGRLRHPRRPQPRQARAHRAPADDAALSGLARCAVQIPEI